MNSRERMLTALNNGRPDRMPCQVHGWMNNYLVDYLDGMDEWQAYEKFDMDYAIYVSPDYGYRDATMANWQVERQELGVNEKGDHCWRETITTPKGILTQAGAYNRITFWSTEHIVKNEADLELWNEFVPVPDSVDLTPVHKVKERLGDKGIIRSHPFSFGQGSPWQSFCIVAGTEPAIMMALEQPDLLHHALGLILEKTLRVCEKWEGTPADMVETDGGAGSSTVISPAMFREFCLPYDKKQNELFHQLGLRTVTHLCGGLMPMIDMVVESGADGLETMTPPSMGGDCDLREASRRAGDKLFFIGGFDQNQGFEHGTPAKVRELVFECFEATKDHAGYICCPSDHFFFGDPANVQAFADAVKECVY